MSKHSKGPWRWQLDKCGDEERLLDSDGERILFAYADPAELAVTGGDDSGRSNAQLISLAPEVASLLRELEWSGRELNLTEPGYRPCCPGCRAPKANGHAPDCKLASLLAKIGEEP